MVLFGTEYDALRRHLNELEDYAVKKASGVPGVITVRNAQKASDLKGKIEKEVRQLEVLDRDVRRLIEMALKNIFERNADQGLRQLNNLIAMFK